MTAVDNLLERIAKIANKPCEMGQTSDEYTEGYESAWSYMQAYLDEIQYLFTVESEEEKNG
jgi:hypothetical protein